MTTPDRYGPAELAQLFDAKFRQTGTDAPAFAIALALMHCRNEQQALRMSVDRLTVALDEQVGQLISATRGR